MLLSNVREGGRPGYAGSCLGTSRPTRTAPNKSDLPGGFYTFPKWQELMTVAQLVRGAVARFDQVVDVSDEDRDLAFAKSGKLHGTVVLTSWKRRGRKRHSCAVT